MFSVFSVIPNDLGEISKCNVIFYYKLKFNRKNNKRMDQLKQLRGYVKNKIKGNFSQLKCSTKRLKGI